MFLASLAAEAKETGSSLYEVLRQVQHRYGGFASSQISLRFDSPLAARELMDSVRSAGARAFPGLEIREIRDYLEARDQMPTTDLMQFTLENGARAIVRPSGTEPKLKVYLDVVAASQDRAESQLHTLRLELESGIRALAGKGPSA